MGVHLVRVWGELDLISALELADWLAGQLAHLNLSSPLSASEQAQACRGSTTVAGTGPKNASWPAGSRVAP
jgi:hypothetical protein